MTASTEIHIDATETDPGVQAVAAIKRAYKSLRAGLVPLPHDPGAAGSTPAGRAAAVADYVARLRRYLAAADQTLYATASGAPATFLLVRALQGWSVQISELADALEAVGETDSAAVITPALDALLTARLATEQEVLLPALAALPGADLPVLAEDFATLLAGGSIEESEVIDVREIPHGQRHPRIFARYTRLAPGESFILVNNHDPKPLRREFEAAHPDAHTWEYVESGPEIWRVRIGKTATDG